MTHCRRGAECRDGGKEFATMADRGHDDADQVLSRQLRQNFAIDIVVAECGRVLLKAELLKPTRDIYRHYEALMVICQPLAST